MNKRQKLELAFRQHTKEVLGENAVKEFAGSELEALCVTFIQKKGQTLPLVDVSPSENEFKAALRLLRDLADCQNGAPLEQHRKEWEEVMQSTYEFLDAHEG